MVDEIHHDYDSKLKEPRQTKLNEVYNIDKNLFVSRTVPDTECRVPHNILEHSMY